MSFTRSFIHSHIHSFIHSFSRYLSSSPREPWLCSGMVLLYATFVSKSGKMGLLSWRPRASLCRIRAFCPTLKFMDQDGYGDCGQS